jgi:hypothetical protein
MRHEREISARHRAVRRAWKSFTKTLLPTLRPFPRILNPTRYAEKMRQSSTRHDMPSPLCTRFPRPLLSKVSQNLTHRSAKLSMNYFDLLSIGRLRSQLLQPSHIAIQPSTHRSPLLPFARVAAVILHARATC